MENVLVYGKYSENCTPTYGTDAAAGADLCADIAEPIVLAPWERILIPSGVYLQLPDGYEGQVRPRSGLAAKHGITVLNAPGTVDSDYRGEVKIILFNSSKEAFTIEPGMRIAQLVLAPVCRAEYRSRELLEASLRGEGGFGSTGL